MPTDRPKPDMHKYDTKSHNGPVLSSDRRSKFGLVWFVEV